MTDRIETFHYDEQNPDRLDKYLVSCLPEFSRARIQGLIIDGFVLINGVPAKKAVAKTIAPKPVKVAPKPAAAARPPFSPPRT